MDPLFYIKFSGLKYERFGFEDEELFFVAPYKVLALYKVYWIEGQESLRLDSSALYYFEVAGIKAKSNQCQYRVFDGSMFRKLGNI